MKPTRMYGTIDSTLELGRHLVLQKYHEPLNLDPEKGESIERMASILKQSHSDQTTDRKGRCSAQTNPS
jgi:hypothetical protein